MFKSHHARYLIQVCLPLFVMAAHAMDAPDADGEVIPDGEAAATATIVKLIRSTVQGGFDATGHAHRDAHRKAHACVRSTFTVLGDLPPPLAQGLFAHAGSYHAWIRYSNGSGQNRDDRSGDGRGMAVKVVGVPGKKLLDDEQEAQSQDFVMINHPVFFVRNAADYVDLQQAIAQGTAAELGWLMRHFFHEGLVGLATLNTTVTNPLNSRYWSMTPYKLGASQIKFSARPCAGSMFQDVSNSSQRMGENLVAHLASRAACFDFMVQTRTQPAAMPIEDPTIEWSDIAAPFVTVAKIQIPAQAPEPGATCETLSFSPWHALIEQRPLGGINRIRKDVYLETSRLRHTLNGQARTKPAP
jgi:hypothetical protein